VPRGVCKLCLKHEELQDSHLLPRAAYKSLRARAGNPNPLQFSSMGAIQISKQITDYLLCRNCEGLLNREGETQVLPLLATLDGFPLVELLQTVEPDLAGPEWIRYSCSKVPEIQVQSLVHFAVGVFWKASVHCWRTLGRKVQIALGPYEEDARQFLLGQRAFPDSFSLTISATPLDLPSLACFAPFGGREANYHNFLFFILGITFVLWTGRSHPAGVRTDCLVKNPNHPIIVSPHGTLHHATILRRELRRARTKKR